MDHPRARSTGLLSERVGDETVVLDERSGVAHCLSPALARAWDACDGTSDAVAIARRTGLDAEVVATALTELEGLGLLEGTAGDAAEPDGLSRRDALGRLAKRAAIVTSVPLAYSLAVGTPANADSISCAANACILSLTCNGLSGAVGAAPGCRSTSRCVNGRCSY